MKYYMVKDAGCELEVLIRGNCSKKMQRHLKKFRKQFTCHKFSLIRVLKY